jgi:Ca-activated chloride channel family protein
LAVILVATVAALAWWSRRRRNPLSAAAAAQQEIARLRQVAERLGPAGLAQELSVLMRRAAISFYPRDETAAITGAAWLAFLDRSLEGQPFSRGPGRLLATLPYRPAVSAEEAGPLLDLCARWLDAAAREAQR